MIKIPPQSTPLPVAKETAHVGNETARKLKLKHATQAFESIFIEQMLKSMRSTSFSPKEEDGFGKDIMMQMADEGVSKQLAKSGMIGIGDLLYRNLEKRLALEQANGSDAADLKVSRYIPRAVPQEPDATSVSRASGDWRDKYHDLIVEAAKQNDLPPQLVEAVIAAESNGKPDAVSRMGALGLMQLMPDTARVVGVSDPLDPQQNISGGARYLRQMLDRFDDLRQALAAYNAGPTTVERHGGVPPIRETQAYVDRIISDISNDK